MKPLKRTFLQFSPGRGAAEVWPWNKFYLAPSQEHELPLSLQLAHCKLCRRGVPNKQMTRANITCTTLFFTGVVYIFSPASSLKLYVWKSYIIIMNSCHSSHLQRLQNQITEMFLTLLLDLQTIQAQCSHRHREGKSRESNWSTDEWEKQKGRKNQPCVNLTVMRPHKISFWGANIKNCIDTNKCNHVGA